MTRAELVNLIFRTGDDEDRFICLECEPPNPEKLEIWEYSVGTADPKLSTDHSPWSVEQIIRYLDKGQWIGVRHWAPCIYPRRPTAEETYEALRKIDMSPSPQ